MAYWAYVKEDVVNSLASGGNLTLTLLVTFWDDTDLENPHDNEQVAVTFDIDALLFGANAEIVNAIQAHADTTWSWTVPANHIVHRQLARGLL